MNEESKDDFVESRGDRLDKPHDIARCEACAAGVCIETGFS